MKAQIKTPRRLVYNYSNVDFDGLRESLSSLGLTSFFTCNDAANIDADWQNWKDAFLAAVADHVPTEKA